MFFQATSNTNVKQKPESFIIKSWDNFEEFSSHFNSLAESFTLKGVGFTHNIPEEGEILSGYQIFNTNVGVFAFVGESLDQKQVTKESDIFFTSIVELSPSIFTSMIFKTMSFKNNSIFSPLDCEVPIELKEYLYNDEEKILISKAGRGNIDLFCSYVLNGNSYLIKTVIHQNLHTVSKNLAMNKLLEERINNLKNN